MQIIFQNTYTLLFKKKKKLGIHML